MFKHSSVFLIEAKESLLGRVGRHRFSTVRIPRKLEGTVDGSIFSGEKTTLLDVFQTLGYHGISTTGMT